MIKELRLTNFRKHESRTFNFEGGLNVMRGANEAGKSTLISSLLYLWFGTKALDESLSGVVTYGQPEKSLRVEGDFVIDGVDYTAYRSPSGAELAYGNERVTGQTAVTQFMERILGAKTDTVRKLMIAEQNSVRGILDSEATAGALIETLAELGMIDTLIEKIQNQLVTGPTKGAEATLQTLQEAVGEVPVCPSDAHLETSLAVVTKAESLVFFEESKSSDTAEKLGKAKAVITESERVATVRKTLQARVEALRAVPVPGVCPWTSEDVAAAERSETDEKFRVKVETSKAFVPKTSVDTWTGTEESAEKEIAELSGKLKGHKAKVSELKVAIATKKAMKINEGVCSFCKLDISQRPEVLETNTAVDAEVMRLGLDRSNYETMADGLEEDIETIQKILVIHRANMRAVTAEFWEPVGGLLPASFRWIGPEVGDSQRSSVSSSQMKSEIQTFEVAANRLRAAVEELGQILIPDEFSEESLAEARQAIEECKVFEETLATLKGKLSTAKFAHETSAQLHVQAVREYETSMKRRDKSLIDVKKAEKTLFDMLFNNQLIKDLREARSEIRRRLWVSVTAAISVYFSRIRQVETRITQGDEGFLQNGKPVKGLSGSAKDSLGLAIRAGLMKTFIPNAPLMVVDEPFAACDSDREVAGLAMLSTLGFPQTILVTHSDLADSLATKLVQL